MLRRSFISLAALPLTASQERSYASEHPDMLLAYLSGQLNDHAARWDRIRDAINTPEALLERNREVRRRMTRMMHGFPDRCPLSPRVTASFERPGYRVENLMFQSRPDFWVTGNLYLPTLGAAPFPGIISPCGHYAEARMSAEYQSAYINLVLAGFAVLAFDPIGQGERRHFWDPATDAPGVGRATTEHSLIGQQLLLTGQDLTQYRVWDAMRAVDYLLSRSEIDPGRIGCAGHSGGGTVTRFTAAVDERIKVAVINEGGTANRWPARIAPGARVGPSDVEQNLFPGAALGVDHVDMQVAIAPRPLLVLIEDFSPAFNSAVDRIRGRYELLGAAEKFRAEEATDPHAWTVKLRQATTHWFSQWFLGKPGPATEPDFEVEPPQRLYATSNGSVRHSRTGSTIYGLLARRLDTVAPRAGGDPVAALGRLLGFRRPDGDLATRHLVTTPRKHYRIEKVEFLSEPGIYIPTWVFVPERTPAVRTVLYVHESGKEVHGGEFGALEKMALGGTRVVAIDVRGIGATRPPHPNPSDRADASTHLFDVETAMAYMAWYLDRSLLGMRVQDVVRGVDYALSAQGATPATLTVMGTGMGALWTLFATVLDSRIEHAICRGGLKSYRELASAELYTHGANVMIRDVLLDFDIPDLVSAAGRRLVWQQPVDARRRTSA